MAWRAPFKPPSLASSHAARRVTRAPSTCRTARPKYRVPVPPAKTVYHTSLANVDWLHGSAESLLTVTNIFVVVGLRAALGSPRPAGEPAPQTDKD